jgi:hypothetical protein
MIGSDRTNWVVALVVSFALLLALLFARLKPSTDQVGRASRSSLLGSDTWGSGELRMTPRVFHLLLKESRNALCAKSH